MNDVCSIELLQKAVARCLSADEEAALHAHLEHCEACCAQMEQLAGGEAWQQEAAALLSVDELDAAVPEPANWSEVDFSVEHLDPSDDANVLGQLGGYDVLAIVGRGGMGVVLKAFDRELKRLVAIKALAPHLAHSSVARKRFAREAQAAAAVVNPHVIAIHHVQPTGRLPFLIMPLLTGESLAQRLKARGPLELTEVLRIGMQAATGLAAAHDQGLVHRDVKPANIFLEKGVERVVITDFGLARAADDVSMTRQGVVAGTPEYMSPEQARGEALDGRSDLFSLGCVLYEMATGVSPFRTDSTMATLRRIVDEQPAAMASLFPELPPWFSHIVERLLSKDPTQRFASASEVSQLLEQCLSHLQQPTSVSLPASLLPHATGLRSIFNFTRKGVLAMFGTIGMTLLGIVLWQATEPPDIGGQWTNDEWGTVVLEATGSGEYEGTFTGSGKDEPAEHNLSKSGTLRLKWSRVERRFNGTWGKGADRSGTMSLRMVDKEICGGWTTDEGAQLESGTPLLGDLMWTRSRERNDGAIANSSDWEMHQVFNPAHDQNLWAVAFTPDGKTIASAAADQRVKFWDVATGALRSTVFRSVNCTDVAYSPDGIYLAIAGGDHGDDPKGEVVLFDGAGDGEEFVLESHESSRYSTSVDFSPDNRWLASGGSDKTVKIWSVPQRKLHKMLTDHTELVSQVVFSPNGKMLASASFDDTVRLWSVPDGDAIATLCGHKKEVRGIAFSSDGKLLVSASDDGTARVWNTSSGEQLGVMDGHGGPIFSVAFAPDGQYVATGSRGPSGVIIWNVNTRKGVSPFVLPQQKQEVVSLAFSPDGQMLAIVGGWNGFQIWKRKVAAEVPGIEKPLDRQNARAVVEAFVAAAFTVDEVTFNTLARLRDRSEAGVEALCDDLKVARLPIQSVYVNDPDKPTRALSTSESVRLEGKKPTKHGQRDSVLMFTLTMSNEGWLVTDIDVESKESADRGLKEFLEANPNSISVPPQGEAQPRAAHVNPLVGHWKLVKLADMPVDQLVGATVVIDEHRFKMHVPSQKGPHPDWRYTLGANGDIDLVDADDVKGESNSRGMYSLKGNTLYLALNAKKGGHPRPESTTGEVPQEGVQYIVLEFDEAAKSTEATKASEEGHGKREVDPQGPEQPALSKTLQQLQGKWQLTRQIAADGDESATPGNSIWEFKGDRIVVRDGGPGGAMLIQVDELHSPVHVEVEIETADESGLGLLSVEKDKLTLCLGKSQKTPIPESRPEKLQWVSGIWYMELQRVKPGETIVPLKPKSQSQPQEAPSLRASPVIPPQTGVDDNKASAVDRRNARSVVEAYVTAALASDVAKAAALAKNAPADSKRIAEIPKFLNVQRLTIKTVYVNDPASPTRAVATSEDVKLEAEYKQPNGQRDGFLVLTLTMSDVGWFVTDIDFESEEGADDELKKFLEANPKSIGVPPLTAPAATEK